MKKVDLPALKAVLLEHKKEFHTKDIAKKSNYEILKVNALERIGQIEEMEIRICKYLNDIDEYLEMLRKKSSVNLLDELVDKWGAKVVKDSSESPEKSSGGTSDDLATYPKDDVKEEETPVVEAPKPYYPRSNVL